MPNAKQLLLALLLSTLAGTVAQAAEYWVDPVRGNDANPGTLAQPFKTLTRATTWPIAARGDTVRALPGTYNLASGESSQWFGLRQEVRLIGSGIGRSVVEDCLVSCNGCAEITGITFRGTTGSFVPTEIDWGNAPSPVETRIHDCEFDNVQIFLRGLTREAAEQEVLVERNFFHDIAGPAFLIYFTGTGDSFLLGEKNMHVTLRNNLVVRAESLFRHDQPPSVWAGGEAWTAYPTIVNNTAVDLSGDAVRIEAKRSPYAVVAELVVTNNVIANAAGYGIHEIGLFGPAFVPLEVANNYFSGVTLGVYKDDTFGVLATVADLNATLPQASANVDAAPIFVDPVADDYRLAPGSPGIDAALDARAPPDDLEGDPRPLDGDGDMLAVSDVGADEYRDGPSLLRNTDVTDLAPLAPPRMTLFPLRSPRDDYLGLLPPAGLDDPGVLADPAMKLVLYQLVRPGNDLFVVKRAGELYLEY